jgi:hypothetical protein
LHNTEPGIQFGPYPQWSDPKKIVSLDPYGHEVLKYYGEQVMKKGLDIRPTIAITKAHIRIPEIEQILKEGRLAVDGQIALESGDLKVCKAAVEPVWYLPGVAERFGVEEQILRRALL